MNGAGAVDPDTVTRRLAGQGVDAVAIGWVDNAGLHRVKAVPLDRLAAATQGAVTMSRQLDAALPDDAHAEDAIPRGADVALVPDLGAAVALAAVPGWAWAPADRYAVTGEPHALCQRGFLRRMVALAAEHGLSVQVGAEVEWVAGHRGDAGFRLLGDGPAFGMIGLGRAAGYLRDVLGALRAQGVPVRTLHPEAEPGSAEVALGPLPPVAAADAVVLARETVRSVAAAHGLDVTFAPVPDDRGETSVGAHLHLSLWRGPDNLCGTGSTAGSLTAEAAAFVSGVLRHLPAILAVATPSRSSYARLVPDRLSGCFREWSLTSRFTAVRVLPRGGLVPASAANVEVKCFDATANPYLAIGTLVAAGLAGVSEALTLPPEATGDEVAVAAGVTAGEARPLDRLPADLHGAVAALRADPVLPAAMGEPLTRAILAARAHEAARTDPTDIRWRY